jgi:hypothetical protein
MSRSADPQARLEFIAGLRALADYLAVNPAVPVPPHGDLITVPLDSIEEGGAFQVRQAARALGATVVDETSYGGHFYTERSFGLLGYRIVSIPDTCLARHQALWSYAGSVDPDYHDPHQATL